VFFARDLFIEGEVSRICSYCLMERWTYIFMLIVKFAPSSLNI